MRERSPQSLERVLRPRAHAGIRSRMASAAQPIPAPLRSSWRVSRDGLTVAVVTLRNERGAVVVNANLADGSRTHRFESLSAADAFVGDLIASFSYLGCDVAAA